MVFILSTFLVLVGAIGGILPVIPGTTLIFAGAVLHKALLGADSPLGWWTLGGLFVLLLLSFAIDFLLGAAGAKYFGSSKWGVLGGVIGGIVGLFFFPFGLILGPLFGVLTFELFIGKKILSATKSGVGSAIGTTLGIFAKSFIGVIMALWFFIAIW